MSGDSVLLVDPGSSGKQYIPLLQSWGIDTVLLDTERGVVSKLRTAPTPGAFDFARDFGSSYRLLYRMCLDRSVKYVVTGAESAVELCERLRADLPHCPAGDPVLSQRRWNKQFMFEALAAAGVPSLHTSAVDSGCVIVPEEAVAQLLRGEKLVVKPALGAASVDVRMVETPAQLTEAVTAITDGPGLFGDRPSALIQQMYPAPRVEYAVDTFSTGIGHELLCVTVYDKRVSETGDFVYERGRWLDHDDPIVTQLRDYAFGVLDALGVGIGPAHMEIMSGPLGPRLIDFGARAHGIGHPGKTFRLTGNSQIHRECEYIAELFGIRAAPVRSGYALSQRGALVFFSLDRRSRYLGGAETELADLPGVLEVRITAQPGQVYPATRSMIDSTSLGMAFVVAETDDELDFRCTEVRKRAEDAFATVSEQR